MAPMILQSRDMVRVFLSWETACKNDLRVHGQQSCPTILISHSAVGSIASCLEIVGQGEVGSLLESLFQGWNVSYGLIQLHALYPVEWIEDRGQTTLLLRSPLLQPFIEGVQVQPMYGNSGRIEVNQLSPDFFPGTVKNNHNGGMKFHGSFCMPRCGG